jgi:hypothetical protein
MTVYRLVLDLDVAEGWRGHSPTEVPQQIAEYSLIALGHEFGLSEKFSIVGCAISRPMPRTQPSSGLLAQPVRRINPETGEVLP